MASIHVIFKLIVLICLFQLEIADSRSFNGRIVGGHDVNIEDYPYQVSILAFNIHKCGGSIITEQHIITAAHCTDGYIPRELQIVVGSASLKTGIIVNVAKIYQHPNFTWTPVDNDISIIKLVEPLQLSEKINIIALPSPSDILADNTIVSVSGWGDIAEGSKGTSQLQAVELLILSKEKCIKAYGQQSITDNMICTYSPVSGKDACKGDSGGPLVFNGTLYGVVSWGRGCAREEYPGVYANVATLRRFIDSSLSK